jgi:hypothetical protein
VVTDDTSAVPNWQPEAAAAEASKRRAFALNKSKSAAVFPLCNVVVVDHRVSFGTEQPQSGLNAGAWIRRCAWIKPRT